jgi:uracil-DNA glycosylase
MTVYVPPDLPRASPCQIAFLGEAPGDEEVTWKEDGVLCPRPLVGPSGRIFNAALRAAEIDRRECWVGNVFSEKLPENEVGAWCAPKKEADAGGWADLPPLGEGYLRPEHRWHLDRLGKELRAAKPTVIVPLGGTALWALTGHSQISRYRGAVQLATRVAPGVKIFPTWHPAFVMRLWKMFPVMVQDFLRAVEQAMLGPKVLHPTRRLLLEPTLQDLRVYKRRLLAAEMLSVDIETGWGQMTCIGFGPTVEDAIVVPFVDLRRPNKSYWRTEEEELEALWIVKEVMESPVKKVGQNFGAYDAYWLLTDYGIRTMGLVDDTRLLHHALYAELPKDLEFMGASYTDQGPWKTWGKRGGGKKDD